MRRGSSVFLVYLVWAALSSAASAEVPEATPALRPLFLHLEESALADRPAPTDPLVQVPEEDFRALIDRYEAASRARDAALKAQEAKPLVTLPPALPAMLRRVTLVGAIDGQTLSLAGQFECGEGTRPESVLELLPAGWALTGFRPADPNDRLGFGAGGVLEYRPGKPGAATFGADVAVEVQTDRSRRSVTLALPAAPDQQLTLTIPGPVSGIAISPAWLPATVEARPGGAARVTAPLGFQSAVTVTWMAHGAAPAKPAPVATVLPPPKPQAPAGARLFVNVSTLHSIGDGIVRFHSWIDLVNSRDRVGAVTLSLPLKVSVRQVTGQLVKSFEVSPQNDRKEVRVVFSEAFRGRTRVELDGESAIPRDGETALPIISVAGAVRVHGICGISVFATYRVDPVLDRSVEASAIDVSELPAEVTSASPSPVLLAFRCSSPRSELRIKLTRFTPHQRLSTAIEGINAVTVMSPAQVTVDGKSEARLRTYTRMVMKVSNAGQQDLRFTLPNGAHIESCFVDLVPQVPARMPAGQRCTTYLIPLKLSSVMGNRLVPFPVEVSYRQDIPHRLDLLERVSLPFPALSAPATDTTWNVYTPDGQRVVRIGGAFHEVASEADLLLVTAGQTIFEMLIYRGGKFLCLLAFLVAVPLGLLRLLRRRTPGATASMPISSAPVITMGIAGLIVVLMASVAVPNFKSARERANTRACYANQKTVVGAMEMYNLDKNTKRTQLDTQFFSSLRSGGYLQSIPQDPGQGPGTSSNYHECDSGNGITCHEHGSIQ